RRLGLGSGDACAVGLDDRGTNPGAAEVEGKNGRRCQEKASNAMGNRGNSSPGHETAPTGHRQGPCSPLAVEASPERLAQVVRQPPILKTLVPHFGQVPESACLPFFMVTIWGFWTSTFILSFTQYAIAMRSDPPRSLLAPRARARGRVAA